MSNRTGSSKPSKKGEAHQKPRISWTEILIGALVDLIVGTVLILLSKVIG